MATFLRTTALRMALAAGLALAAVAPALAQAGAPDGDDAPSPVPDGSGCAGVVARWQDFAERESKGGHMDDAVYGQVRKEVDRASRLCGAGQDAQARRAVAESKRRHGYPP